MAGNPGRSRRGPNPDNPFPVQKPQLLHAMQHDPNYAYHPHPHGSWVGAVEMDEDNIILLGSLGLDAHVELVKNQLRGWYESGTGDWFVGCGTEQSVFSRYAELLGQRLGKAQYRDLHLEYGALGIVYILPSMNLVL